MLAAVSALLSLGGLFIGTVCAVYVFAVCCLFFVLFVWFMKKRYKGIRQLTEDIDRLLNSGYTDSFDACSEGELSILRSEIRKLAVQFRENNDRLTADKIVLSDSLADISHQLRTPLTSINIILSLLGAEKVSDERRFELINELNTLLNATDRLVTLLLKIARLDSGAVKLEKREVKVKDCAAKAVSLLEIALEIKNIDFRSECAGERFIGDPDWTAEALGNILKNCIEHTPEGGSIRLTAKETPIFTSITVTDTGGGIREEDIPHLFERFYRGSGSPDSSFGLGLNLACAIAKQQNGTVKASNTENGACFEIKFYKTIV